MCVVCVCVSVSCVCMCVCSEHYITFWGQESATGLSDAIYLPSPSVVISLRNPLVFLLKITWLLIYSHFFLFERQKERDSPSVR